MTLASAKRRGGWSHSGRGAAMRALFASSALAFSAAFWPEEPSPSAVASPSAAGTSQLSASELERLSVISTRLARLNERLRTELEASKLNSSGLETSLATSTRELEGLRLELRQLRLTSTELELRAANSERESIALLEALRKADASLRSLEASFGEYRRAAEASLRGLRIASLGTAIVAAAGWIVALLAIVNR